MAAARAINTMGLSLVMAFLGVYVVEERGYPAWLYGVIALIANLGQSVVGAWAGALSDRIGRRPLITGALFIRAGVIALLGAEVLLDAPLLVMATTVVVSSALRGCFEPVAYALVSDVAPPSQRIAAFGLQRMGTNLGWAIGPAMGGVLTLLVPYGAVFFVATVGLVGAALITGRVADPADGAARPTERAPRLGASLRAAWADPVLRPLLVGTFVAAVLHTQMFSTFAIFMSDEVGLAKSDVGLLYTLNGAAVLLLQAPAVALLSGTRSRLALPAAALVSGLGFTLIGFAEGMAGAAAAILVITCAEVIFSPAHQAAAAVIADPARRGQTFGLVSFAQTLGVAFAPLIGGGLLDLMPHQHVVIWASLGGLGLVQAVAFHRFLAASAGR
ncbi:MAG: MFS transporter [Kofleriaceae bacterium]|jgi:MFS family permease|nr:MFS transporter [Kofleriaceae bacterium]MBP9208476.1 MFS transporter [Kofleriaceae bacterium]